LYIGFVFLLCYISLALLALQPSFAFDSYWHLQMGKDLIENGLSPWVDHYSFTYHGEEISSVPIIFQSLLYFFVSISNDSDGFYYIQLFYVTLMMSVVYLYFRQIKAPWFVVVLVLPFIVYFVHLRLMVRPEIISNVLIVVCLSLYLKARASFATKEMLAICLLLLFWVNYHSPVFGYIIIFGLFMDKGIQKIRKEDDSFSWLQWGLWGGLIFSIGFIKPNGEHFLFTMYSIVSDGFSQYIQEYAPSNKFHSKNIVVYLSWILSIYVAIWALMKRQYGFAFIAVILTYFSWSTTRLVTAVSITNFCILAFFLSQVSYSRLISKLSLVIRGIILITLGLIVFIASYYVVDKAVASWRHHKHDDKLISERYPAQVVDYLKSYQSGGNILNDMAMGGYLINKLSPDYKMYIDGRTNILYPIEFVEHNQEVFTDAEALAKEINNVDIQYALYKNHPGRLLLFKDVEKLKLNFADDRFLLFSESKKIAFPLASKLMVLPMCWKDEFASLIESEILLAEDLFEDKTYDIQKTLSFMKKYIAHENKPDFLSTLRPADLQLDSVRRLAAYLALSANDYHTALSLFSSINKPSDYDILVIANSLIKEKDYYHAEGVLYYFYTTNKFIKKNIVSYDKIYIFVSLLNILKENNKLKQFPASYLDVLQKKLDEGDFNNGEPLASLIPFHESCEIFFE